MATDLPAWKKLLFALLPLLLLLSAVELAFRLHPHRDAYETLTGFVEPDPELIWRLKPQPDGPLATNELGLRDLPYDAGAEHTVLLLGDSMSWGNGIDDVRRVYPQLLEARLDARYGPASWEVVNASVPGYSTFQELAWLRLRGPGLGPDALVLQFCLNDVDERYRALAAYGGNNFFLGVDTRHAVHGLQGFLLRRSRAFEALLRGLQRAARGREEWQSRDLARDELPTAMERAWQRMMEELDGVRRAARDADLPFLLLIAPFRFQAEDPEALRQPQDRLLAWAREHSLPAVDVLAELATLPPELRRAAFYDETHFSELGHALAAELAVGAVARLRAEERPALGPAERWAEAAAELARHGEHDAALELLAAAERTDPAAVAVHRYRANILYLRGDLEGARQALLRVLELAPDDALARRNLDALARSPPEEAPSSAGPDRRPRAAVGG